MSGFLWLFVATLISGLIATASIFFLTRYLKGNVTKALQDEIEANRQTANKAGEAIERALSYTDPMLPYDDVIEQQGKIEELEAALAKEREALGKLESALQVAQSDVDAKEVKHNELKLGKEASDKLADSIKANQERLQEESSNLEQQVEESKSHIESLMQAGETTKEQKVGLEEIANGLTKSHSHLSELKGIHDQASTRFMNLQAQYTQLEIEYRNLVEKQLAGEE